MNREELDELYLRGLEAQDDGNIPLSFQLFMQGALSGDAAAQNAVALAYDSGSGVEQDKEEAIKWFKKAWKTDPQVGFCANIGITYVEMGRRRQGMYWWKKAIALGDGDAAVTLAKLLMKSDQVLQLLNMAVSCEESWQITPGAKEEAEDLLALLIPTDE